MLDHPPVNPGVWGIKSKVVDGFWRPQVVAGSWTQWFPFTSNVEVSCLDCWRASFC